MDKLKLLWTKDEFNAYVLIYAAQSNFVETIEEKEFIEKNLKLTHWGYFEPWDPYRNYLFSKTKYSLKCPQVYIYPQDLENDQTITIQMKAIKNK